MSEAPDSLHVVVVGAGISGLATAWYLEQRAATRDIAVKCTVLEQSERAGGKIVTDIVDAKPADGASTEAVPDAGPQSGRFVVEGGPDSFLAVQKPWGMQLSQELGLVDRLIGTNDKQQRVFVVSRGRTTRLPEGIFLLAPTRLIPFLRSPLISPLGKLRMGLDLLIPARKEEADETLGDFVKRRFGGEALDKIAEPLLSGIYSAEVDRQSLLATFPRFLQMEHEYGSLIRAMRAGRRRRPAVGAAASGGEAQSFEEAHPLDATGKALAVPPRSTFVSFGLGMSELTQGLLAHLSAKVRCGRTVVGIEPRGGRRGYGVRVRPTGADAGNSEIIEADAVVLAAPAFASANMLHAVAPTASRLLHTIRYVSSGTISLGYRQDASWIPVCARLEGFGILVPASEKRPINAITWSSVKFPGRAPAGHSLLRVFFGGSRSPRSFDLEDEELLGVVKRQLLEIMGIQEQPLFHRIHRWPRAIPQYDLGHLDRVAALEYSLPADIHVTGSPYRGIGIPDCARQAAETAERVIEGLKAQGGAPWR